MHNSELHMDEAQIAAPFITPTWKKKKRDERERGTKGRGREVEFKEINLKVTHLMHKYRTGII